MKIGEMLKLGVVLAAFATAACVGLAFVYAGTAKTIAVRSQADLESALRELFPEAEDFVEITGTINSDAPAVKFGSEYEIQRAGETLGVAIRAEGIGFNGALTVLVGVDAAGTISGAKILEHAETPGLGANAASPGYYVNKPAGVTFMGQYAGKPVTDPFVPKNDIIAITAATITSRGVSDTVKAAGLAGAAYLAGDGPAENGLAQEGGNE
ncbi:MAG: FMN-binding protein [Spirochaetaceae bacterium]|jgi:electron transport complex protein RnfG|nr:FMN-binding protein [Spirochaetaceae bacterium]